MVGSPHHELRNGIAAFVVGGKWFQAVPDRSPFENRRKKDRAESEIAKVRSREGISKGRFATAEDAAREALREWEERQRRRTELLIELDAAEASFARGTGRRVTPQSIPELIAGVKRRARSRLELYLC